MAGGQRRAEQVVVRDRVHPRQVDVPPAHRDRRDGAGDLGDDRRVRLGARQDEAVGLEPEEAAQHRVVHPPVQPPAAAEHQVPPVGLEDGDQAVEQVHEPRVADVVEQHPDGPAASLAQGPGRGVGPVAKIGDGLVHGRPPLGADLRRAAQHERDQGLGDPGPFGHVTDGGPGDGLLAVDRHPGPPRWLLERSTERSLAYHLPRAWGRTPPQVACAADGAARIRRRDLDISRQPRNLYLLERSIKFQLLSNMRR